MIVLFDPDAIADLEQLHEWIEGEADIAIADAYLTRVRAACEKLTIFPARGSPREDLGAGLRSISFENRRLIIYRIEPEVVRVVRVMYGGRDLEQAFGLRT